ncbi:hypothetical protein IMG5_100540 [Ichthyophthirius multifiliis]|uniref:Transmembrane protein n=1 Tax=Ichthyophthirius multifiliis TaxID=5932 RepID=G0QSA6_ICHMU|nr:hypothetical protein IMG5_100540 [Ichthyophthirius multifiliis]EGR31904.1 hypothetical protein IMG5_100540 [Ichthyophthirius multifiliis]|eukprot:XP_004035390.1 hypothetical protein IMG5_100540 [Ichthyophthirius multifiliis]
MIINNLVQLWTNMLLMKFLLFNIIVEEYVYMIQMKKQKCYKFIIHLINFKVFQIKFQQIKFKIKQPNKNLQQKKLQKAIQLINQQNQLNNQTHIKKKSVFKIKTIKKNFSIIYLTNLKIYFVSKILKNQIKKNVQQI